MFLICLLRLDNEVNFAGEQENILLSGLFEFAACAVTCGNKSGLIVDENFKTMWRIYSFLNILV